ncbi:glycylpeptide N-tetradecanoyltransferase 2 [Phytophthora infestans T30-4]|uniref:Glycylpeptide N-tetradecanoyltransferase n=2 Tax=Phytophthora infestans TaxID=4787 RepID=D0N9Y8_PHYIT|nr:glycylpeptide N-tetradecanoyltransferase 2 [Phytophthora infestans T30-4]EEY54242.1 glycylpeptide N-tetradecanoyltransferase 2 [Phytophthora infestans T30-4]KAF4029949.1 Myristoyl-CoA:protein N-myristoyltransferase C-terminal domain [Phytophthora infestans]KAF4137061.1 Myristoyl-CoA:protein N-myristoyltransferase C-terminal domain-containing protein [Phytophthora infestans]|eukprot:XP_002904064.1 glycylpeptide N-tetradecanoyltransferase 2 [Phytophthora infestans T30-4]
MNQDAEQEDFVRLLKQLNLVQSVEQAQQLEKEHRFWDTQPVPTLQDQNGGDSPDCPRGPIDVPQKTPDQVRQEPYHMPSGFTWSILDVMDPSQAKELYELLSNNYVEDTDSTFRFDYSVDFLQWALTPPGYHKDWHIGVRSTHNNQLMAFIAGIPAQLRVYHETLKMAEINFLCVHKRLRDRRLAPVLIKEVTRRVNLLDIWQAVYTAGVVLPMPVTQCRYFHRSLNPKKLIEVGFSPLPPRMTLAQTIKTLKLPTRTSTLGFRAMERTDVPAVRRLLRDYLAKFHLAAEFSEEEVAHWMVPRVGVVNAYVVEDPTTQEVTDVCSFYHLPSTIIGNDNHKKLSAVYSFYNVARSVTLAQLMQDALVMAKRENADVFNALDVMENVDMLQPLKFGPGSGELQYYLFNWRCPRMSSDRVGVVLC